MNRSGFRWLVVGAMGVSLAGWALAQDRPAGGKPGPGAKRPLDGPRPVDGNPPRPDRPGDFRPPGPGGLGGPGPIRPEPQDFGPLRSGEEPGLMNFARENVPVIYGRLNNLKAHDSAGYQRGLSRAAPRLRQLQRLFAERPAVARRFIQHIENGDAIGRAAQAFARNAANPNARQRAENDIRRRVAENLTIEHEVLTDHADDLEGRREAIVKHEFGRVTAAGADLAPEPPRLREAVRRIRETGDDASRKQAEGVLRDMIHRRIDDEIDHARKRAEMIQKNSIAEVDAQTKRILDEAEQHNRNEPRGDGPLAGPPPAGETPDRPPHPRP